MHWNRARKVARQLLWENTSLGRCFVSIRSEYSKKFNDYLNMYLHIFKKPKIQKNGTKVSYGDWRKI